MKIKIYVTLLLMIFFCLIYYIYLIKFSNDKLDINEKVIDNETAIIDKNENVKNENVKNVNKDLNYEKNNENVKLEIVKNNEELESIIIEDNSYTGEFLENDVDLYV